MLYRLSYCRNSYNIRCVTGTKLTIFLESSKGVGIFMVENTPHFVWNSLRYTAFRSSLYKQRDS